MVAARVVESGIIDMELEISVPVIHWHNVEPEEGLKIFFQVTQLALPGGLQQGGLSKNVLVVPDEVECDLCLPALYGLDERSQIPGVAFGSWFDCLEVQPAPLVGFNEFQVSGANGIPE